MAFQSLFATKGLLCTTIIDVLRLYYLRSNNPFKFYNVSYSFSSFPTHYRIIAATSPATATTTITTTTATTAAANIATTT
mmetsp:Transcript_31146/g.43333  ORF Transcript_31146/g.43333 Transcript_31146/m.43333 type:complete len:80 (-) Transcript_31146:1010-1249(-)